jgi:hypothetical protein
MTWWGGVFASLSSVSLSVFGLWKTVHVFAAETSGGNPLLALPIAVSVLGVVATVRQKAWLAWVCAGAACAIVILWLWSAGTFFVSAALASIVAAALATIAKRPSRQLGMIPIFMMLGGVIIIAVQNVYLDTAYALVTSDTRVRFEVSASWLFLTVVVVVIVVRWTRSIVASSTGGST